MIDQEHKTRMPPFEASAETRGAAAIPISEMIDCLIDALSAVQHIYTESNAKVTHLEHLTQDYLHALELEATTYHERARIATLLKQCREERRPYKNNVYMTESITAYLKSKEGQKLLGRLEFLRNLARNTESAALGKKYSPRVLTKIEYKNVGHKLSKVDAEMPKPANDEEDRNGQSCSNSN